MGLLDGLEVPKTHYSCRVVTVADTLAKDDRTIFLDAVNDLEKWPSKTLARVLSDRGVKISPDALVRHRGKQCSCSKG